MEQAESISKPNPIERIPPEKRYLGKPKGAHTKQQKLLKDALMLAADLAGKKLTPSADDGLVQYLVWAAIEVPGPFLGLLGKVLPMQMQGTAQDGSLTIRWLPPSEPPVGPVIDHEGAEDV